MKTSLSALLVFLFFGAEAQKEVLKYHNPYAKEQVEEKYTVDSKGNIHGVYRKYTERGKLAVKAHYRHGQLHGKRLEYFDNRGRSCPGTKPAKVENYYKGDLHGKVKVFQCMEKRIPWLTKNYEHGTRTFYKKRFKDGSTKKIWRRNGDCVKYYENGNKAVAWSNKKGKKHGKYKVWYKNGTLGTVGEYSADWGDKKYTNDKGGTGKKVGEWVYDDREGELLKKEVYGENPKARAFRGYNSIPLKVKEYEDGELIKERKPTEEGYKVIEYGSNGDTTEVNKWKLVEKRKGWSPKRIRD